MAPRAAPCQMRGASTPAALRACTGTAPTVLRTQKASRHIRRCRSCQTIRPCPSPGWRAQRLTRSPGLHPPAVPRLVPPPQPQRPRLATWGPQQAPINLRSIPCSPPPAHLGRSMQAVCYHLAPLQAPSDNPATVMDARTDPAAGPENELSGSDHSGSSTQLRPQAQRAGAARCAANNAAPGKQPAVTVPSRRGSDWRPGPICLPFNSAPRGAQQQLGLGAPVGETSQTSKPRPATCSR